MSDCTTITETPAARGRIRRRAFLSGVCATGLTLAAPPIARAQASRVGAVLPLSGGTVRFGQQARLGLELAAREINAAGGILGQQITLEFRDTAADPAKAEQAAKALVADAGTLAVAGPITSASRNAISATMMQATTPLLYATDYEGGDCDEVMFYFNSVPNQSAVPLMRFLLERDEGDIYMLGADYIWPHRMFDVCAAVAADKGRRVADRHFVPLSGLSDYGPVVAEIRDSGARILIMALPGIQHEAFIAAAFRAGLLDDITVGNLGSIALYAGLGTPAGAIEAFGCVPFVETDPSPGVSDFVDRVRASTGTKTVVSSYMATHYNALMALKAGCEKSGDLSREAAVAGMAGLEYQTPTGSSRIDAVTHHSTLTMFVTEATSTGLKIAQPPEAIEPQNACAAGTG